MSPAALAEALVAGCPPPARADEAFGLWTVEIPAQDWRATFVRAHDQHGLRFFDWLSAVDELAEGFRVLAHLLDADSMNHLLISTTVPRRNPRVDSLVDVFRGAAWHERETHEMFGIDFTGHPGLTPLLLPDSFDGHPLRKDFVLAARVAKTWPGARELGEGPDSVPRRRVQRPPGVPDPSVWGPAATTEHAGPHHD